MHFSLLDLLPFNSYFIVKIEFETFYGQMPQKPNWVRMYTEEIARLKPKKLPISDIYLHEQFKKYFGYKKAIKLKVRGSLVTNTHDFSLWFFTHCLMFKK